MQAKIITIGDEILVGQTVDTNSTYIAKGLNQVGIKISEILSITDTENHILESLDKAIKTNDFVIITGGLGPTNDDITKKVLTSYFKDELIIYPEILERIKQFFIGFNKPFLDVNYHQAMLPKNAKIIENDFGTASGMWFTKDKTQILALPGVPYEMKGLFDKFISQVKTDFELGDFYHSTLLLAGVGEAYLAKEIENWEQENKIKGVGVAYLPQVGQLKLRLTGTQNQKTFIDRQINKIKNDFPKYVVGESNDTLEQVIGDLLRRKKSTLGVIESCTGGTLASKIVSVPGSSTYFEGGVITYSNRQKEKMVGVDPIVLNEFGAVSEQVVIEMAAKGRSKLNVDYCISVSGVSGPDGGSEDKPIGLVWIAIATPDKIHSKQFNFGHNRSRNIESATISALNFLRLILTSQI